MKLTKVAVSRLKLPSAKTDHVVFDDELKGFGVRLREGGKRTWIIQYRIGTKQRRLTLGDVEKLDADDAREQAKERLAQVTLGGDPQHDKVEARARAGQTLGSLIDSYLNYKKLDLRESSYREIERYLQQHWRPLHGLPVHEITRRDVAATLNTMRGSTAPARARAALSGMLAWAVAEGLAESNAVIGSTKPPEPAARDRVLSDGELVEVWSALGDDDYGKIVKLALLTAARREEIGGLMWHEIDFERAVMRLPSLRTKNRRPLNVPLTPLALSIIKTVESRGGRDHLFGSGSRQEGNEPRGFQGWGQSKKALDAGIEARRKAAELAGKSAANVKPMAPWRLHDLRHTAATVMADRLAVLPHVIEAALNHVSGHKAGVAGIYNHARYEREVRDALLRWSSHIDSLVEGTARKVVPLHGRA